jgi:tricorn protease
MKFFRTLIVCALLFFAHTVYAETSPLWMRHVAISPDGKSIAFSFRGDIFTVPVSGGQAVQITSNAAYDSYPVWSPDSKQLIFASGREGSLDIYLVNSNGGIPRRLTTYDGKELPLAFLNDTTVLFSADKMPSPQSIVFDDQTQVYSLSINSGRPKLFSSITMEAISVGKNGDLLYYDKKGYEDEWRKHHRSPITRDIWLCKDGHFTRQTTFNGEDRNPVWTADGRSFYYLSERDGTSNVYRRAINDTVDTQLTHFKDTPVRFLSSSSDGTLCFGYDGEIYTMREGAKPSKVSLSVTADSNDHDLVRQLLSNGASDISLSPSGKEIAFILHGDVYVTSVDYSTTKQITDTPEQERSVSFSPDGRSLVYASERGGVWQIYVSKIKKKEEKSFTYATDISEEQIAKTDKTSLLPKFSPDGNNIAYFEDRGTLRIYNIKSGTTKTAIDGKYIFSYSDGDVWYEWSPDSRWLLTPYLGNGGWSNVDIALVSASGNGEIHDLTESGYNDTNAKWVLGGKAMIFSSDRAGFRSHGSWGSEDDVYIMFFDVDAYDRFRMTKEERALQDEANKEKKDSVTEKSGKSSDKKTAKKKDDKKPADNVKPLQFDFDNCIDRVIRLTANSTNLGDAVLSNGGDTLYYQASYEGGYDLWRHVFSDGKTEIALKNVGSGDMQADKDFKHLYLATGGHIKNIDLSNNTSKDVSYEASFNYKPYKERAYMFDHIWRQVKDKFYEPTLHGVDWTACRQRYERFLPYINNGYDFSEMLSEMLGELNASHTGARFYPDGVSLPQACLGVFFDQDYSGDGLRIAEVIKRSPFTLRKTGVTSGCIIEQIDGQPIKAGSDYNYLLVGKVNKPVRCSVYNPSTGRRFDVTIKGISRSDEQELLYKRWVDRNTHLVDSLSNGQIAYVHVKEMDSKSFREVYSKLLNDKNRNRKAAIVDERHNGGGWLHDDLCTLLSGREYQRFIAHGKYVGRDPYNKWVKPSCVLVCEDDYSNGHGFPWVYKTLGIGKIIGAPVAGTMTAVWWERLIDNHFLFGVPEMGCQGMDGQYCENRQLNPDIEVYNTPEDLLTGHDRQLETAVKEMMNEK